MKLSIFIISLLFASCSTTLRDTKNNLNNYKMNKFDIEKFKSQKVNINEKYTEVYNDTIIEVAEYADRFIKNTRGVNSPIENRKVYDKKNYSLIAEVNYFHKFPVGISRKYDSEGQIIEEKNQDEKYDFSVDELINKMKNEFNIDLRKFDDVGVDRRYEEPDYIYVIILPSNKLINSVREIKINGANGNLISDSIVILKKD